MKYVMIEVAFNNEEEVNLTKGKTFKGKVSCKFTGNN